MRGQNSESEEYVTCAVCHGALKRGRASAVRRGGRYYPVHRECDFQSVRMKKIEYLGGTVFTLVPRDKKGGKQ